MLTLWVLWLLVGLVQSIDLRSTSNLQICERHMRESRRIIPIAEQLHIFNDDLSINEHRLMLKVRKGRLLVNFQEKAKEILNDQCPALNGRDDYNLFLHIAPLATQHTVAYIVRYDPSFFGRMFALSTQISSFLAECIAMRGNE